MNLTLDLPVTAKGDRPSLELVQLMAAQAATITALAAKVDAQAQIIAALTVRVSALETP